MRFSGVALFLGTCGVVLGQSDLAPALTNWPAPLQWQRTGASEAKTTERAANSPPLSLVATTPCRILDTRPNAPMNQRLVVGPIAASQAVTVPMRASACGLPSNAIAYSLNFTVDTTLNATPVAFVSAWPAGDRPNQLISIINAPLGGFVANAAIVPAGTNGAIEIFASNPTHVIIDLNGYFTDGPAEDGPVAVYRGVDVSPPVICTQVLTSGRVNYSVREIDTHNAVTTSPDWAFVAPRAGLYSVTATTTANTFLDLQKQTPGFPSAVVRRARSVRTYFDNDGFAIINTVVELQAGERLFASYSHSNGCPVSGYISIHYVRPRP